MKRIGFIIFLWLGLIPFKASAQSYELQRLILDIEKLSQLKSILTDLYKGYEILESGYNSIKDISEGNFNLHKAFLDGLLAVSPAVRDYERVADIVSKQARIVSEFKSAFTVFKQDKHFSPDEIDYLSTVYNNLVSGSLNNLSNLLNIITASKLRMSDAERLHAIDGIYHDTNDQLIFLRAFNNKTALVGRERAIEGNNIGSVRTLYGE